MAILLLAAMGISPTAQSAAPKRIVSLNLCTDQILLDLVSRDRIAAISHLAGDASVSSAADKAVGMPSTRGEAEQVVGFDPDLVLAGQFSTPATVALLERIGRRVVKVPLASDLAGIRDAIRQVGVAVGAEPEADALIRAFDARVAVASPASDTYRPTALVYQVNGLASSAGSLADAVMSAAGYVNHGRSLGLGGGGSVSLEVLVAHPPEAIVLTGPIDEYRTAVADNLRHPVLVALRRSRETVIVPWRYWLCGTQHTATAIELLAAARARVGARRSGT